MCVSVKNHIATCEKSIFWCEKRYKWILARGGQKTYCWPYQTSMVELFCENS